MTYLPRSISMEDKLLAQSMPVPEAGCWIWTASVETSGYGHGKHCGRKFRAHRSAWEVWRGPIPEGLHVLHKCDTPRCINPGHLFIGSAKENIADRVRKGRSSGGAVFGAQHHKATLTEPQARAIIARYRLGGVTQQALADEYGVGRRCIGRILDGSRWSHITGEPYVK